MGSILNILVLIFALIGFSRNADCDTLEQNNLIVNGSFEERKNCPSENIDINQCENWVSPIKFTTPEFICEDCHIDGIPKAETPFGSCYIRLIIRMAKNYSAQEYIQGELIEPLKKDSSYLFSFWCMKEDLSKFYLDRWSVLFSSNSNRNYQIDIKKVNTVLSSNRAIKIAIVDYKNKTSWFKVECSFKAFGGEDIITLGVFRNHMNGDFRKDKNYIVNRENIGTVGHYYIDNLRLIRQRR